MYLYLKSCFQVTAIYTFGLIFKGTFLIDCIVIYELGCNSVLNYYSNVLKMFASLASLLIELEILNA
jgi:hypothetical protein